MYALTFAVLAMEAYLAARRFRTKHSDGHIKEGAGGMNDEDGISSQKHVNVSNMASTNAERTPNDLHVCRQFVTFDYQSMQACSMK